MHTGDVRIVTGEEGDTYFVRLSPLERPRGGISSDMKTLIFEDADGSWVGSAPVYGNAHLWSLSEEDVRRLARRAVHKH